VHHGNWTAAFTEPLSGTMLAMSAFAVFYPVTRELLHWLRRRARRPAIAGTASSPHG
jgi:hypothetical protein